MTVDRELLWDSWPDGYLAMRGVSTVGGWICLDISELDLKLNKEEEGKNCNQGYWIHRWYADARYRSVQEDTTFAGVDSIGAPSIDEAQDRGDLLPNIDPSDLATWACVKADLATLLGWPMAQHEISWERHAEGHWMLQALHPTEERDGFRAFYSIDTNDPAEAIVRARIQVREETGR